MPLAAEGEFTLGREALETALQTSAEWLGDHELYAALADTAAQQRDLDALLRYTPLAEKSADQLGHTLYQAVAQRAWGVAHRLAGDDGEAQRCLYRALTLFQSMDTRWQSARTWRELGELALEQNKETEARAHLGQAVAAFEAMGAAPAAAQVWAILHRL